MRWHRYVQVYGMCGQGDFGIGGVGRWSSCADLWGGRAAGGIDPASILDIVGNQPPLLDKKSDFLVLV